MMILHRIVLTMPRKELDETEYVPVARKYGNDSYNSTSLDPISSLFVIIIIDKLINLPSVEIIKYFNFKVFFLIFYISFFFLLKSTKTLSQRLNIMFPYYARRYWKN